MLVQKKFEGQRRGQPRKYDFSILEPDTMLSFSPKADEELNIARFHLRVRSSLYQYRRLNHPDWEIVTKVVGDNIHVYRLK